MRSFLNPHVRRGAEFRGFFEDAEYEDVRGYYASHPELSPTPLKHLRKIAQTLGLAAVDAKDETHRFGVNAFKIVGVRYAIDRIGETRARRGVVCATAGNHGRAVARVAHEKGISCTVFVPSVRSAEALETATRQARVQAMREDRAEVIDVEGSYEDAVRLAAAFGEEHRATIVSDMSWDGYEQIPRLIMAGYTQLFEEASTQWEAPPTVVLVQGGVGGLVGAAASWFGWRFGKSRPFFVAVEPINAACLLASAKAGHPVTVNSSLATIMAGLRCAHPSPVAWPAIRAGVDGFVTVPDSATIEAMRLMAAGDDDRIHAGPSGACGMAALLELARSRELQHLKSAAKLDRAARALVIVTEGA